MKINGIILSAGLSSRMESFKPLLNYNGKSFLCSILEKLFTVCDRIGVVTGFKKNEVESEINQFISSSESAKIKIIHNTDFETGMYSSLQAGLKELFDCNWLLYHFVDQPHIPKDFYPEFKSQIEDKYDWIQPAYNQKNGHPLFINSSIFSKILESRHESLKEISQAPSIKKKIWNCNYLQIVEDIDSPEDYQKLT